MMPACTARGRSAYETGSLAPGEARLFRPGGIELTTRAFARTEIKPGARILDLGCGAGDTVRNLRSQGFDAIGVDPAPPPDESQNTGTHIVAPAESLPFADAAFGAVLAECSLSLFADIGRALAECARVLIEGGRLIISDLYARRPEAIAEVRALHGSCAAGMIARHELQAMLVETEFTVDLWEDHSRALRECAARYIFEHGSLDGMWGSACSTSSESIQTAMRSARAGYFLLIATRRRRSRPKGES
jgi:arsenite methyltransferase